MKILRSTVFALLVGLGTWYAQENTGAQAAPEVPADVVTHPEAAPSVEKETPLQALIRGFELVRQEHEGNAKRFAGVQQQMQELYRMPTADAYAAAAVKLCQEMESLHDRLQVERENQIAFKNRIELYATGRSMLRQEAGYIDHYLEELQIFGVEQEKIAKLMAAMSSSIYAGVQNLPPPLEFTNRVGIAFVLVRPGKGQVPFYVSRNVITEEEYLAIQRMLAPSRPAGELAQEAHAKYSAGLNYQEAQQLARGIAHLSGDRVGLPEAKEVNTLREVGYGKELTQAVWLQGKWNAPYEEREAMMRFGIAMGAVWDPARRLANRNSLEDQDVFGELPEAHYDALGCIVIAPIEAGKAARIFQAEAQLRQNAPAEEGRQ